MRGKWDTCNYIIYGSPNFEDTRYLDQYSICYVQPFVTTRKKRSWRHKEIGPAESI